jgi:phage replication-related protein YjqB (UPF0714/DUF867 family)
MLAELIATPGVAEIVARRGRTGVLALHGGLEEQTADIADEIAREADASLYAVVQPDDFRWHVPSIAFDPAASPALRDFLEHVCLAVSLHGFGRRGLEGTVLLGGRNRRVAGLLAGSLRAKTDLRVIDDVAAIPDGLRGTHPRNPVNLPEHGGVQIELSPGAREAGAAAVLVPAVAAVLAAEQRSICGTACR